MKESTLFRKFASYTWFSVLGMVGVSCYVLADTFFIARGVGMKGLAALNIALPAYNFLHGVALMLAVGGATKFTIYKGRGDRERMDQAYTRTVFLTLIYSLAFMALGWFGSEPLAKLLGADEEIFEMTATYLKWLLLFTPAFAFSEVCFCFVRNDGAPGLSMVAMVIGSLANIVFDYLLIFPMGLGILGAVLATCSSPLISMVIMSPHWLKRKNSFHLVKWKPERGMTGQIAAIGFPSLVSQVSAGFVMVFLNVLILSLEGNVGVAAYGVVANLSIVAISVYAGMGQGLQPLVSENYGMGQTDRVGKLYLYAMSTMAVFSLALYGVIWWLAEPIAMAFNSEQSPLLQKLAVEGLLLYFSSSLFMGYNMVLSTYFSSMERNLPAHVLSLLRGLFLIIPAAWIMSRLFGMTGIWLAYPLTEGIVALLGWLWKRIPSRTTKTEI